MFETFETLKHQIGEWFLSRPTTRPETSRQELPTDIQHDLKARLAALPPHPTHCSALAEAIVRSLASERERAEDRNALVVLSSPVEPFAPILQAVLQQQPALAEFPIVMLDSVASSAVQPASLLSNLRQKIDTLASPVTPPKAVAQIEAAKVAALENVIIEPNELAAIPALSECFVRCIEGMNGIESVWATLARDTSRFWIVGCNEWAWKYLERTTGIHSYFSNTLQLPALSGEDLAKWLTPVRSHMADFIPEVKIPEWNEDSDRQFFDALASAANGLSSAAAPMWLQAFQLETIASESTSNDEGTYQIKRNKPNRTRLPDLDNRDRYLLYSVLLHGSTSLPRLAQSLGDSISEVGSQVRQLLRLKVLFLQDDMIQVNPLYYPSLKASLKGHNFLVD